LGLCLLHVCFCVCSRVCVCVCCYPQPPPTLSPYPQDTKRLMPTLDVAAMLRSNPDMVLSMMKGKHLIVYDPPHEEAG